MALSRTFSHRLSHNELFRHHFGTTTAAVASLPSRERKPRYISRRILRRGEKLRNDAYRNRELLKLRAPPLSLNAHGEYVSKYGDWLHNANETVFVRDRRIWASEFKQLRRRYRQEYAEKFRARLATFTRMADAKMYALSLRAAQKKERRRLRGIRVSALSAAQRASKARVRMEERRKHDVMRLDALDRRRDVIRQMLWERPRHTWIVKDNFEERLNAHSFAALLATDDAAYAQQQYPGLPRAGAYDTMEGLLRHSDRYFAAQFESEELEATTTAITQQPMSWYRRRDDSKDEFVREVHAAQLALNRHAKRANRRRRSSSAAPEAAKQGDIEYEVEASNIVPNYWLNIDWDAAFEQRAPQLDRSPVFVGNELLHHELDPFEDHKLLLLPRYHKLLQDAAKATLSAAEVRAELKAIFAALVPSALLEKYDDVRDADDFVQVLTDDIVENFAEADEATDKQRADKRWALYTNFHAKMAHFRGMHWKAAKINFDSALREWRRDVLKWLDCNNCFNIFFESETMVDTRFLFKPTTSCLSSLYDRKSRRYALSLCTNCCCASLLCASCSSKLRIISRCTSSRSLRALSI